MHRYWWRENADPRSTKGERIVNKILTGLWWTIMTPTIIAGVIVISPYHGVVYSIDAIDRCICVPIKNRKMNKDWRHRVNRQAIRMSDLRIWQRDINAYDQHMRKMLAIAEINDLPYEVWSDLLLHPTVFQNKRIYEIAQMFGIPDLYTNDIKREVVEIAMMHYRQLYQELHAIPEAKDVELIVADIIALALVHHTESTPHIFNHLPSSSKR